MAKESVKASGDSAIFSDDAHKDETIQRGKNLDSLVADTNLKFVFVGGKGGVGKTTSSAAIATQLSFNRKVLLVSTDPAHSLSDAFRTKFGAEPLLPNAAALPNLEVMEIDPTSTVQTELASWAAMAKNLPGTSDILEKIKSFQDWLSGIPGIDEATALASAIGHIESGKYDLIVFDTAPTGHTLKLLALPDIIQVGIEKLESWQSTVWSYWETIKGGFGISEVGQVPISEVKDAVAERLKKYKHGIQKVGKMLQDQKRTRFVVVCIAEYLSICETRRLLQELKKCQVTASHIIVNQLVDDFLSPLEMEKVERLLTGDEIEGDKKNSLKRKVMSCCQLTSSRNSIQTKYLNELKSYPEVSAGDTNIIVIEVPLLPSEVTGYKAILDFSLLLISEGQEQRKIERKARASQKIDLYGLENGVPVEKWIPKIGDSVVIQNLVRKPEYNGNIAKIISYNEETNRYGVKFSGKSKNEAENQEITLSIQKSNLTQDVSEPIDKKLKGNKKETDTEAAKEQGKIDKYTKLLQDPEISEMVANNPKLGAAVKDVQANPMNFMKYVMDPEMGPFIQKALSKL